MEAFVVVSVRMAVILLMLSMGLRVTHGALLKLWRQPRLLLKTLLAAFIIVPLFTYLVMNTMPLSFPSKAALWLVAITPGAPMIFTSASRRASSDPDLAASFQVTVALLVIMIAPLWILVTNAITGTRYEIDPLAVARQVLAIQLVPILAGRVAHHMRPHLAIAVGNIILKLALAVLIVLVLLILAFVAGPIASGTGWQDFAAAALVVASAMIGGYMLGGPDPISRITIANANAQRNPGLALAIAASVLPQHKAKVMLVIVVYVVLAALAQALCTRFCRSQRGGRR